MSELSPSRRSRRPHVPNKKYTNDAFADLDIRNTELLSSSEDDAPGANDDEGTVVPKVRRRSEHSKVDRTDDVFEPPRKTNRANLEGDLDTSESDDGEDDFDPDDDILAPQRESSPAVQDDGNVEHTPRKRRVLATKIRSAKHSRSQITRVNTLAGSHKADFDLFVKNYRQHHKDDLKPTRIPDRTGQGGLSYAARPDDESREKDSENSWSWYYEEGGWKIMAQKQDVQYVTKEEAPAFYPKRRNTHKILVGPHGQQKELELELNSSLHLSNTWPQSSDASSQDRSTTGKDGWIINLGSRIRCLAWAPNQPGDMQYLAIALDKKRPSNVPFHDAYHASEPWQSCIEIWAFGAESGPQGKWYMDANRAPQLVHVICSNWGLVRHFKWCPVARIPRANGNDPSQNTSIGLLAGVWSDGFARVIDVNLPSHDSSDVYAYYESAAWASKHPYLVSTTIAWLSDREIAVSISDGQIAIYDIAPSILSREYTNNHSACPSSSPADPPSSVIGDNILLPRPHTVITHLPAAYPIVMLALPYPSPAPPYYILYISFLGGQQTLIDLRSPLRSTCQATRLRYPTSRAVYCPFMLGIIGTEDECAVLRPLRCFSQWGHTLLKAGSQTTDVSTGSAHSVMLIGEADGSVRILSGLARVVTGRYEMKHGQRQRWIGRWFRHEWTERKERGSAANLTAQHGDVAGADDTVPVDAAPSSSLNHQLNTSSSHPDNTANNISTLSEVLPEDLMDINSDIQQSDTNSKHTAAVPAGEDYILRPGVSRITEAFKPEPLVTQRGISEKLKKKLNKLKNESTEPLMWTTIYEEESAITQVDWNPNEECGGWAAAGTGCGLVRVEDLAI